MSFHPRHKCTYRIKSLRWNYWVKCYIHFHKSWQTALRKLGFKPNVSFPQPRGRQGSVLHLCPVPTKVGPSDLGFCQSDEYFSIVFVRVSFCAKLSLFQMFIDHVDCFTLNSVPFRLWTLIVYSLLHHVNIILLVGPTGATTVGNAVSGRDSASALPVRVIWGRRISS